ncbi:MAG: hypothetical protein DRP87_07195 [Spirochaetes bacterium]|nr:MAG: hypothetical protein DRP87_07195 [Spirochaetota bacterium]
MVFLRISEKKRTSKNSVVKRLRTELAFYIGAVNLYEHLVGKGQPVCLPEPVVANERAHPFLGLYDVCLSLTTDSPFIGSDVAADCSELVFITGANQGIKSTFLRSIGLAQLMMQSGMFVPAKRFRANICRALFTHYRREEDTTMKSGKLDEELKRMSGIVDTITADSLILFNESFTATNEREGSEIARQILKALLEKRVKVFFVTHLYDLACSFYDQNADNPLFLRAERKSDGRRTYRMIEGKPLPTSYGKDLYERISGIEYFKYDQFRLSWNL